MIPIGDDNRDRKARPFVPWAIIAANIAVFAFLQGFGANDRFTDAYAAAPGGILSGKDIVTPDRPMIDRSTGQRVLVPGLQRTPVPVLFTILVAMFMHAGIAHGLGYLGGDTSGGVAYAAYIGGFLAGLITVRLWAIGRGRQERYQPYRRR